MSFAALGGLSCTVSNVNPLSEVDASRPPLPEDYLALLNELLAATRRSPTAARRNGRGR